MPIPAKLESKIEAFLATRSRSDGGYAPVGENDIEQLAKIINDLVKAKYEKDPDGDLPVVFELVDRTRYHMPYFRQIPHMRDEDYDNVTAIGRALSIAISNASTAQSHVERMQRIFSMNLVESMEKGFPVRAGDRSFETTTALTDRTAFIKAAQEKATAYLKAHPAPPTGDFQAMQDWRAQAAQSLSKSLGAPVELSVYNAREPGTLRASIQLRCFENDNLFKVEVPPPSPAKTAPKAKKS